MRISANPGSATSPEPEHHQPRGERGLADSAAAAHPEVPRLRFRTAVSRPRTGLARIVRSTTSLAPIGRPGIERTGIERTGIELTRVAGSGVDDTAILTRVRAARVLARIEQRTAHLATEERCRSAT